MITVVIPCKNEMENLVHTLDSFPQDIPVVVADSSTDDTLSLLTREVKVVKGGLPAIARNAGVKEVETPYILFLDADMDIREVPLKELVKEVEDKGYHLVTTKLCVKRKYRLLYHIFYIAQKLISKRTPFAVGGFMLFKKDVFTELGGFNENDVFAEDFHLSMKVNPKKFKIYKYPAYTSDRRLRSKGLLYMSSLMLRCYFNRKNDSFYTKDYNYWS
jgi:glycosyltransferase involved in cell wall biosynthesis